MQGTLLMARKRKSFTHGRAKLVVMERRSSLHPDAGKARVEGC